MNSLKQREGYRYIREYLVKYPLRKQRWALWERQNGKMRRVGTALSYDQARQWLFAQTPAGGFDV